MTTIQRRHSIPPKYRSQLQTLAVLLAGGTIMAAALVVVIEGVADLAQPPVLLGCLASGLGVAGLGYYIIDTIKGSNRPNLYSWSIWFTANLVGGINQWTHDAGPGGWSTVPMTVLSGFILSLALYQRQQGEGNKISRTDIWCLAVLVASLVLLFGFRSGPYSSIAATLANLLAFAPTLGKVRQSPLSETPISYSMNTVRQALSCLALKSWVIETALFPLALCIGNGITAGVIAWYRHRYQTQ